MSTEGPASPAIGKRLQSGDLSFAEFMESALYDGDAGYYAQAASPVGRRGDYVTSPTLTPAFSFAIARLIRAFLRHCGDELSTLADIGCGDGALLHQLASELPREIESGPLRLTGVDRALNRVPAAWRADAVFVTDPRDIPRGGAHLIISNELFDALPFVRLVQRKEALHELCVTQTAGGLDWAEREAAPQYCEYFARNGVRLEEGQFADVSLEWERKYAELCSVVTKGLVVTFDYGFDAKRLFHPRARRFGTAAAYSGHRVNRDLLSNPGGQDLTAHVNFTDLIREGESRGFRTLFFDVQAKLLLALGITEHELFRPSTEVPIDSVEEGVELLGERDAARQLVLPEGIGHDIRVLVQERGMGEEPWEFERRLY